MDLKSRSQGQVCCRGPRILTFLQFCHFQQNHELTDVTFVENLWYPDSKRILPFDLLPFQEYRSNKVSKVDYVEYFAQTIVADWPYRKWTNQQCSL